MSTELSLWGAEVCVDRVNRAGEIRMEILRRFDAYMQAGPMQFELVPSVVDGQWTLILETLVPMPSRLSTLFGEWLYLLRAALDGIAYYLAVRDSGLDPPPNEQLIYFPIKDSSEEYDKPSHRRRLTALSDDTFALLRKVQPFHMSFGGRAHPLWWIDELARLDRHRRGHALAPHVNDSRVIVQEPLKKGKFHLQLDNPVPLDQPGPISVLDVQAPPAFDKQQVMEHMDIRRALIGVLDVTSWYAGAAHPMNQVLLADRMATLEWQVSNIVEPIADGSAFA